MKPGNSAKPVVIAIAALLASGQAFAGDTTFLAGLRGSHKTHTEPLFYKLFGRADWGLRVPLSSKVTQAAGWGLRVPYRVGLRNSLSYGYHHIHLRNSHSPDHQSPDQGSSRPFAGFLRASLDRSDALRASIHQANAAHYALRATQFRLLPTLSLEAETGTERDASRYRGISEVPFSEASITANWTVYSSGANWYSVKAAKSAVRAADLRFLATERQAFVESANVYLELYANHKTVRAIESTLSRLKRIKFMVRRLYDAGLTSRYDIAQVDAEIESVVVELETAQTQYKQQRIAYRTLTGHEPDDQLSHPGVDHLVPSSKQEALERALKANISVMAASADAEVARYNSKVARAGFLPRVSLFASTTAEKTMFIDNTRRPDWRIGARLTIPLVDLSAMSTYREAKQNALSASYQARDTRRQIERDVETAWTLYQSQKRQHEALARKSKAINRSITALKKELNVGTRPVSDLLREEIELTSNTIQMIRNEFQLSSSAYRIAAQFSDFSLDELAPN